jgi:hypothetical protein
VIGTELVDKNDNKSIELARLVDWQDKYTSADFLSPRPFFSASTVSATI